MADYEKCLQKKDGCAFWANGYCLVLVDTAFSRSCPFYKPAVHDSADWQTPKYEGMTFRWIKGLGGNYLISREGKVINSHGQPLATLADYKGRLVVKLQYKQHYIQIPIDDLLAETYGGKK